MINGCIKKLNNELRIETNKERAVSWEGQRRELQELNRSERSDLVYSTIQEIHQGDRGR